MNVKISITRVDPNDIRANGEVRLRAKQTALHLDISSRRGYATAFDVDTGKYTYVFGVDRTGTFTLVAVNTDTNAQIGKPKLYTVKNPGSELRYLFEVP